MIEVSDQCDNSLSRANIRALTPQRIEDLARDGYMEAAFVWRQMMQARLAGVREDALLDLLVSRVKGIRGERTNQSVGKNKSFFLPYILRWQEDVINSNAFVIVGGSVGGAGSSHPGAYTITVENTASQFTSIIPRLDRYFIRGETVITLNLGAAAEAQTPVMNIISSRDVSVPGTPRAEVVLEPPFSPAHYNANILPNVPLRDLYRPADGIVQIGTNSVSDYESWCHNQPVDLSRRTKAYWPQTARFTRCWDDKYEEYLEYIMAGNVNPYLELFKELPMAEQNKKMFANYQKKWRNTMFYGQSINENQTVEEYTKLPHVNDPRTGTFIEYKSNAEGIRTQLARCGRVLDLGGAALNVNDLEQLLYTIKRNREVDGATVVDIDLMTDRATANKFKGLMSRYYQVKYGQSHDVNIGKAEPIMFGDQVVWQKQSYEFDEVHVRLNIITENAFSDWKEHWAALGNSVYSGTPLSYRANQMWLLDWGDIEIAVTDVAARKSNTPDLATDPDFKCIIKANITHYEMESVTATPIIESENRHLIIENFSNDCPTYQAQVCEPTIVT